MKQFLIAFEDAFTATNEAEAIEQLRLYLARCVEVGDFEAFTVKEID
jgi:hypothetical protein